MQDEQTKAVHKGDHCPPVERNVDTTCSPANDADVQRSNIAMNEKNVSTGTSHCTTMSAESHIVVHKQEERIALMPSNVDSGRRSSQAQHCDEVQCSAHDRASEIVDNSVAALSDVSQGKQALGEKSTIGASNAPNGKWGQPGKQSFADIVRGASTRNEKNDTSSIENRSGSTSRSTVNPPQWDRCSRASCGSKNVA